MISPFYKFLMKQHLMKQTLHSTTFHNTVLGIVIKSRNNKQIPLHEKYETIDFTPKKNADLKR